MNRSEFVLAVDSQTHLTAPLLKILCDGSDKMTFVVKFLPDTVGGSRSENKLPNLCE
jgi:hypothetical protein